MNTKEWAKAMREAVEGTWIPLVRSEQWMELAKLLDKLPIAPDGFELTWDYRELKEGEWGMDSRGVGALQMIPAWIWGPRLVLRKIEPEFKPGEIVADSDNLCFIVEREELYQHLLGGGYDSCPKMTKRLATRKEVMAYLKRFSFAAADKLIEDASLKYGRKDK